MRKLNNRLMTLSVGMALLVGFGACKKTEPEQKSEDLVTYNQDSDMAEKIKNYSNADWLFQHYFADYGVPENLKSVMATELKMVANGFALQYARNENVKANIAYVENGMMLMRMQGKFGENMAELTKALKAQQKMDIARYHQKKAMSAQANQDSEEMLAQIAEDRNLSPAQVDVLEDQLLEDERKRKEQEELVKKYNLPYTLEDHEQKIISVTPGALMASESFGGSKQEEEFREKHPGFSTAAWWQADLIYSPGGATGFIDHIAFVATKLAYHSIPNEHGNRYAVIEANLENGIAIENGILFCNRYDEVEGHYLYGYTQDYQKRDEVIQWAENKLGTKYQFFFSHKQSESTYYCSKFVWQGFYEIFGLDLDSDGGSYVFPADITRSPSLIRRWWSSSVL